MSKHYLLDIYQTDPSPGRLKDVYIPTGGSSYIDGSYVVRVSDDIVIPDTVDNANDLLTEKYAGMLANSGLFTRIIYDDMFDPNGINMAASVGIAVGQRGVCSIFPSSFFGTPGFPISTMRMNMVATGLPTPSQCMVNYEVFTYGAWDTSTHAYRRYYQEESDALLGCEVSWNNGATWLAASHGDLLNIPPADQGNQLIIRFTQGGSTTRYYLGSWAVLY